MEENQKDQQVTGNQGGQENQRNQDNQLNRDNPTQKPSTLVEQDEEKTDTQKENPTKEHQHDFKTPVAEKDRQEKNQDNNQNKNPSNNEGGE